MKVLRTFHIHLISQAELKSIKEKKYYDSVTNSKYNLFTEVLSTPITYIFYFKVVLWFLANPAKIFTILESEIYPKDKVFVVSKNWRKEGRVLFKKKNWNSDNHLYELYVHPKKEKSEQCFQLYQIYSSKIISRKIWIA